LNNVFGRYSVRERNPNAHAQSDCCHAARNSAKTLVATYNAIPKGCIDGVVLVDNKSRDETVKLAEELGIKVVRHPSDAVTAVV